MEKLIGNELSTHSNRMESTIAQHGKICYRFSPHSNENASLTHLNFKCEIFLEILDDHDEEWELDA